MFNEKPDPPGAGDVAVGLLVAAAMIACVVAIIMGLINGGSFD